jgi:hypothetical protein
VVRDSPGFLFASGFVAALAGSFGTLATCPFLVVEDPAEATLERPPSSRATHATIAVTQMLAWSARVRQALDGAGARCRSW